eukprot:5900724-Lingulodinium_polyedra.AAC.1
MRIKRDPQSEAVAAAALTPKQRSILRAETHQFHVSCPSFMLVSMFHGPKASRRTVRASRMA